MSIQTSIEFLNDQDPEYLAAKNGTPEQREEWEDYNKSEGMVHLCRIKNGKRLAPSAKNLLNITPTQFAELNAA